MVPSGCDINRYVVTFFFDRSIVLFSIKTFFLFLCTHKCTFDFYNHILVILQSSQPGMDVLHTVSVQYRDEFSIIITTIILLF